MSDKPKILLVEDEEVMIQLITHHLQKESFNYQVARDGWVAYEMALEHPPDLFILDLMLPEMGGFELCSRLKFHPRTKRIPILILTAKSAEKDKIEGFERGADDYLVKPFSARELLLRLRVLLKRSHLHWRSEEETPFLCGDLKVFFLGKRVFLNEKELDLTVTEFQLLEELLKAQGRVLTRSLLLDVIWGEDCAVTPRTIDTHLKRLRVKLRHWGDRIETVRGVGYRLKNRDFESASF